MKVSCDLNIFSPLTMILQLLKLQLRNTMGLWSALIQVVWDVLSISGIREMYAFVLKPKEYYKKHQRVLRKMRVTSVKLNME